MKRKSDTKQLSYRQRVDSYRQRIYRERQQDVERQKWVAF